MCLSPELPIKGETDYKSILEVADMKEKTEIKCGVDFEEPNATIESNMAIIFVYSTL